MKIIDAVIQGLVQGASEFLPISSSGHLSLIQHFTKGVSNKNGFLFSIILHMGTLFSIFIIFWKRIKSLVCEFFDMLCDLSKGSLKVKTKDRKMLILLIIATIPLLLVYIFKDVYISIGNSNNLFITGICFIFTSILIFLGCLFQRRSVVEITYMDSLMIGFVQMLTPFPGVSRSGSTVSVGLLLGMQLEPAIEFSFIMSIPAVLGGCFVELLSSWKDIVNIDVLPIFVGFMVSMIAGCVFIKFIKFLIKSNKYIYFAYYTGILGILVIIMHFVEKH